MRSRRRWARRHNGLRDRLPRHLPLHCPAWIDPSCPPLRSLDMDQLSPTYASRALNAILPAITRFVLTSSRPGVPAPRNATPEVRVGPVPPIAAKLRLLRDALRSPEVYSFLRLRHRYAIRLLPMRPAGDRYCSSARSAPHEARLPIPHHHDSRRQVVARDFILAGSSHQPDRPGAGQLVLHGRSTGIRSRRSG